MHKNSKLYFGVFICFILILSGISFYFINNRFLFLESSKKTLNNKLTSVQKELLAVKNEDQYKKNKKLEQDINNIHSLYKDTISSYEQIQDFKAQKQDSDKLESSYAAIVKDLSDLKYSSAESKLKELTSQIDTKLTTLAKTASTQVAAAQTTQTSAPTSNTPPANGYNRQQVQTDSGTFTLDIISADLNSTKVIIDTASEGDCGNDCLVLPLATYATRSNAYAAINGTFFCPAEYPSCADKTNSFDTLLMNKNKTYFNSSNNVYSTVPVAVFKDNWSRFMPQSLEWGRDTSIDAVIAMQPLLVLNGQIAYSGSDNTKYNSKGARNFIAGKGNMVYIGTIYNANMAESAKVLKTLGIDNALNLDEGGSTALWYNGSYLAGPGRNIPNAVLFVKK